MSCKHPEIEVRLVGSDGNAFVIISKVTKAMKRANLPEEEIAQYQKEAMGGDYQKMLVTTMEWVDVK